MEPVNTSTSTLFYKKIRHYNVPGHLHFLTFSCFDRLPILTNDLWRGHLAESLQEARRKHHVDLWAYVFMPEHVHLLVRPKKEKYGIESFLKTVKQGSSRNILVRMKEVSSPLLDRLSVRRTGCRGQHAIWLAGPGYDMNLWTPEKIIAKARYCHWNPVRRGLVKDPARWRWSSYRWLELGCQEDEPIPVDDWDF